MTDNADDVARRIWDALKINQRYIEQTDIQNKLIVIADALREYGDERAIKQLKVDQIYLDAERKKADAEGFARGVEEGKRLQKNECPFCHKQLGTIIHINCADSPGGASQAFQRGDRLGGGE